MVFGAATSASASGGLQGAADSLLASTHATEVVFEHPPYSGEPFGPNGWSIGQCWERTPDPNDPEQSICHYARGASVVLIRSATARQAVAFVRREIRKGYRQLKVPHAALAGIALSSHEGAVTVAVRRFVAIYTLGSSSDDDPNPPFPNIEDWLRAGAKALAENLTRPGCPAHPGACLH